MIAIANDHTGIEMKNEIIKLLNEMDLPYHDFGISDGKQSDYPLYAARAAHAVAKGECSLGILICGTGIGIGISANKVKGIRCATCSEPYSALMARQHNNANMISFGARVIGPETAKMIVQTFIEATFLGGRHEIRVKMISAIEHGEDLE